MDMRHKLATVIVNNPPEKDFNSQGSSHTEKKGRKKLKEEKKKKGEKKSAGSDEINDSDGWGNGEDDGVWISDTSAEAIAKRAQEQLTSGISGLVIDSDMEKTEEERVNIFFKFVQMKRGKINSTIAKEILAEAQRLEIKNKAPLVLCELLFNDKMFKENQIKKNSELLRRFTGENLKGQKYLIGGIEKTIESYEATLLPKVHLIFNELYEEDILDEEIIIEWAKKVSKKNVSKELAQKIHDKAAPFIKWLREAEEETSESEFEIEYDERKKISRLKEVLNPGDINRNNKEEESNKEEDDIVIDDI